jgi:tRNA (cytidine/uridine-2'-O-)-methyltransferase
MKIALYQPDIAQNLGTTLRTAACLGIDVEIIEPCGFPLDDRKLKRSGMDYIDHVKYTRHNDWNSFKNWAKDSNHRIILLSSKATTSYTDFKFQPNDILMAGRETAGVPAEVSAYCENSVTIPMQGAMRSLNVAVSVAVVLGEAIRQTRS